MQSAEAARRRRRTGRRPARAAPARCRPRRTGRAGPGRRRRPRRALAPAAGQRGDRQRLGPAALELRLVAGAELPSARRGRSRPSRPRSGSRSSASSTERAEASEISCSLERPPRGPRRGGSGVCGGVAGVGCGAAERSSSWRRVAGRSVVARRRRRRVDRRLRDELPDDDRHERPGSAASPPWASGRTMPSCAGSVASCVTTVTVKPAPRAAPRASASVQAGHVGHLRRRRALRDGERDLSSPAATPCAGRDPARRRCPSGWSDSTSVRATAKPRPRARSTRCSYGWPMTFGTVTGFGALRDVDPDARALQHDRPGLRVLRDDRVRRLGGVDAARFAFRLRSASAATASAAC